MPTERPEPAKPDPARALTRAERIAKDARTREALQRRKEAGQRHPGAVPDTIIK